MHKPRTGTPRAKWLKEFKSEEELKRTIQFTKRNIGKCYKIIAKRFFF
jgi:hypothetical protein